MAFNPNLFHEKYRIDTTRAKWWEFYEGIYFVTICTQNRKHYFGEIQRDCQNGVNQMHFSELGKFVNDEIPKIMDHYPYAHITSWVVMPNHVHILILIDVRGRDYPKTPTIKTASPSITSPSITSPSII